MEIEQEHFDTITIFRGYAANLLFLRPFPSPSWSRLRRWVSHFSQN